MDSTESGVSKENNKLTALLCTNTVDMTVPTLFWIPEFTQKSRSNHALFYLQCFTTKIHK